MAAATSPKKFSAATTLILVAGVGVFAVVEAVLEFSVGVLLGFAASLGLDEFPHPDTNKDKEKAAVK
ncbi:hypothetical protein [Paenibacillus sp. yr247]|uniref:hypothetical protein n=1 Tax=Paenibacillus sp. yr247 TaxID=1761880 RepID=UPI0020C90A2A|nr:hypothetical protein [Paenibacillus sp. yr247]